MCKFPIIKNYKIEDGKVVIDWKSSGIRTPFSPVIRLNCGKCSDCQKQRSSEWATRCLLEASKYSENCILTLTYAEAPPELVKRHYQTFLKRLRRFVDRPFKYFLCGEYGAKGARPHYHCILFGYRPPDLQRVTRDNAGTVLYNSYIISKLWTHGFVSVGDVDYRSCLYTAKYMQKQNSELAQKLGIQPPFVAMSKGIASDFASLVDYETDRIYVNGRAYPVPRYFDKLNERDGTDLSEVRLNRRKLSLDTLDVSWLSSQSERISERDRQYRADIHFEQKTYY